MPLLKMDSSMRICSGLGVHRVLTGSVVGIPRSTVDPRRETVASWVRSSMAEETEDEKEEEDVGVERS